MDSKLTRAFKRMRPGSGPNSGPASRTMGAAKVNERRPPRPGVSAPGNVLGNESISWPVALSTTTDTQGNAIRQSRTGFLDEAPEERHFEPYAADDPRILSKLFGIDDS